MADLDLASRPICITVLAHNEERRIAACLTSLPLNRRDVAIHVVINGSSDATARIASSIAASADNLVVHEFAQGGKARSWNRFLFDTLGAFHPIHIFVDGDAEIAPGSIDVLASALIAHPDINAVAGVPRNGRRHAAYRAEMIRDHGMFGDLYGLRGAFLDAMRQRQIRLPDDIIGDDSLVGALAKTDLEAEHNWQDARIMVCEDAGFLCEPTSWLSPRTLKVQRNRMVNYSVRRFQNGMISEIMRSTGPQGLPQQMATLYPASFAALRPRAHPVWWWFDRKALHRMRDAMARV